MSREPQFLSDEDFNRDIVIGLLRRVPTLDLIRIQEIGLSGAQDPAVLDWAAAHHRIVLTHDASTMIGYACDRIVDGRFMPGMIVVRQTIPTGLAVEHLWLIATCSMAEEWENQIRFVPL